MASANMNRAYLAAELNNLGVTCVHFGDLRQALDLFRGALRITMGELEPHPDALRFHARAATPVSPSNQTGPKEPVREPASQSGNTSRLHVVKVCAPFVHAQGINLIPCPSAYSPDELVNTTITSGIILFNLALVYHLKGLGEKMQSIERLSKAKSLYHKSHLLLVDAGVPLHSTANPVIDMLVMTLFNNLAHACYELAAYEDSRRAFDQLIRFALTIVPSRYGDAYIGSVIDQLKSNFLLNAIILQAPKLAAAA